MGGLGSGRPQKSQLTTECIAIDTMHFKKYLRTPGIVRDCLVVTSGPLKDDCPPGLIPGLAYTVERYEEHAGKLTLDYVAHSGDLEQKRTICITLSATPCNYGGVRWWMMCPVCDARRRVVYVGKGTLYPMCRECQDLHYQSQRASYIERHITYEKYLLSNYGYDWEHDVYNSLKEHYFKITPEYEYKMRKSQLEVELYIMRHLIAFEKKMLKTHIHAMTTLQSDEDRQLYLELIVKERGQEYALNLLKMLSPNNQIEQAPMGDTSVLLSDESLLRRREKALEQEIEALEKEAA